MSNTKFNCRDCGREQEFNSPTKFLWWETGGSQLEILCVPERKKEDGSIIPARKIKVNVCVAFPECRTELPHLTDEECDAWLDNAPANEDTFDFYKRY